MFFVNQCFDELMWGFMSFAVGIGSVYSAGEERREVVSGFFASFKS